MVILGLKVKRKYLNISLIVIATVLLHSVMKYIFAYLIFGISAYNSLPLYDKLLYVQGSGLILCFFVVALMNKFSWKIFLEYLGIKSQFFKPLLYASLAVLPMFIGFYLINGYADSLTFQKIFWMSIWAGINEEIVFRAFLVGILVRFAHWPFFLTAVLSGSLFGLGHLYQAENITQGIGVFLFTTAAGIGFAAFYKFWNWNIWFPLILHVFMNLSWVLFYSEGNVLMDGPLNIFRGLTIMLAVLLTILFYRRNRINNQTITTEDQ